MEYQRLIHIPDDTFLLLGMRGTGKSTWLDASFHNGYLIDLLEEGKYQALLANPEFFAEEINKVEEQRWIIVDEIQRLPNLLNEVHRLHQRKKRKFALCGSSARKLKRAGVNLLGGRASRIFMHPFLPQELGADFELASILRYGSLPIVWQNQNREQVLKNYTQLYLKEEIQAEASVKNLPAFARFLPIAALFHGQVLNISALARDAKAQRTTINGYIEILEDTLIGYRLAAFSPKLRVREKKHSKFYLADSGIVRTLKHSFGEVTVEEKGSLFEGWVANTLRAYNDYRGIFDQWFYWSPGDSNIEVDFLLQIGKEFIAIEAKSSDRIRKEDFAGLRAIAGLPGLKRRLAVYPGKEARLTEDGIEIIPIAEFVRLMEKGF